MKYDVVVIGGGAAGLLAAGAAASKGLKVLVVEKMERVGRKLLITGKGRCNITNTAQMAEFIKHIHPNGKYLRNVFSKFFSKEIIKVLEENELEVNEERGGRVFPKSEKAADVVESLMRWLKIYNVDFLYHSKVLEVIAENEEVTGVKVFTNGKETIISAKNVILATGGKSYPATGSTGDGYELAQKLGHSVSEVIPGLVPLVTEGNLAKSLQGLSLKNVEAVLWVDNKKVNAEFGELLFTHFGLSGPIILTLSREVVKALAERKKVKITLDLKPALDHQKLDLRLLRDLDEHGKKKLENIFKLWLPSKMIQVFFEELNLDPNKTGNQLKADERKKIRNLMKSLDFEVVGNRSFKEAIITVGGIKTSEVSSKTMESKLVKNLFIVGEVLDLDADTGGYNLQIAFSTGWLAGKSCTKID
jgi:predicted Rossmann fold flavoprotein